MRRLSAGGRLIVAWNRMPEARGQAADRLHEDDGAGREWAPRWRGSRLAQTFNPCCRPRSPCPRSIWWTRCIIGDAAGRMGRASATDALKQGECNSMTQIVGRTVVWKGTILDEVM